MKTSRVLLAVFGLFAPRLGSAVAETGGSGAVEVIYRDPEDFTDVKGSSNPANEGRDRILAGC